MSRHQSHSVVVQSPGRAPRGSHLTRPGLYSTEQEKVLYFVTAIRSTQRECVPRAPR